MREDSTFVTVGNDCASNWPRRERSKGPTRSPASQLYDFRTTRKRYITLKKTQRIRDLHLKQAPPTSAPGVMRAQQVGSGIKRGASIPNDPVTGDLFAPATEQQRAVGAAEAEGIRHRVLDLRAASVIRD